MASYSTSGDAAAATVTYGALNIQGDRTTGVAFLTGKAGNAIVTETAVPALGTLQRAVAFAERTPTTNTGVAIASPLGATTIALQLRDAAGTLAASASINLAAGAQTARFLNELFPAYVFPATFRGTITATSTVPVTMVTLRTAVNESSEFLITTMPVADLGEPLSRISYVAHFAAGAGYVTDAILVNPEATAIEGTLEWRNPAGQRIGTATQYTIPARGAQVLPSGNGSGQLQSGYLVVRAADGQNGPIVRSVIYLRQTGRLVAMTGMFPSSSARRSAAFMDLTAGHDSGLAILNDGGNPATVRLTPYGRTGMELPSATIALPAGAQIAAFASQLFPDIPQGFRGTVEISSDNPIQTVALRSTATPDRFLLAAFPVESLEVQRNISAAYFPHLVDGGGFSTEIFVMNLGAAAANARLSFLSPEGQSSKMPFAASR